MRKLFIILLSFLIVSTTFGDFYGRTFISTQTTFNKLEGKHTLLLKQNINTYYSNGLLAYTTLALGVKIYWYDTTKPFCQGVTLYKYNNGSYSTITLGQWYNIDVFARIACYDNGGSGCQNQYSNYLLVPHLGTPGTTFKDNVGNSNTCNGNMLGKKVLIDVVQPKISIISFGGTPFINPGNPTGPGIFKNAGSNDFHLKFEDPIATSYGVSGIKNYNFNLIYIKDFLGNTKNTNICTKSSSYHIYNATGSITTADKKDISFNCNATNTNGIQKIYKAGKYRVNLKVEDFAGNIKIINRYINIVPNNNLLQNSTVYLSKSLTSGLRITPNGSKYANNLDKYHYTLKLKDEFNNPIYNKKINIINQTCAGITGCNTIHINETNKSGGDSLIEGINYTTQTNSSGSINFTLKSYTPGIFTQRFKVNLNKWNNKYLNKILTQNIYPNIIGDNTFKKPVKGDLKVSSDSGATWNAKPEFGTSQKYKITLNNIGSLGTISHGKITIIKNNSIKDTTAGHKLQNFKVFNSTFISFAINPELYFISRINATSNILKAPIVSSNKLVIKYKLGGKSVKYYLDNFSSTGANLTSLGLKVVGTLQGGGKASITGQKANFSDISKSTTRLGLKRKIYTMIRGMKSNTMVNGIRYIKGKDVKVSGNNFVVNGNSNTRDFETLVVEDGNLIIGGNITTTMGIFVLNNNLGNKSKGNVYVNSNVTKIDAIIYADGGFISSNSSGLPYIIDNTTRTSVLQNQLILTGSLFTRNTIGGAVFGTSGKYILPGGNKTNNFNEAMKYDLNYIRRGNVGCLDITGGVGGGSDGICDNYKDYFIIIYNPTVQTNPPKGF